MRWTAVVVAALVIAAPAAAGSSVTVPAPAIGKVRVVLLTIKASSKPTLKATNTAALGPGFDGVALVGKSSKKAGTYLALVAMFTGNLSKTTAPTVNLDVSNGTPSGAPVDETENCSVLMSVIHANAIGHSKGAIAFAVVAEAIAYEPLRKSKSPPKSEFQSDVSYQAQAAGCH